MSLLPNEVKTEHIANIAVTTPKIADEAITNSKLKDSAVTTDKLATGAVTGSKIGEAQIYGSKLKDGAVRAEKIAPGAVTTAKIGEAAVTGSRIADRTVASEKLAANCVTTEKIANGAVTPAKLSFTPPSVARPITPPVATDEIADASIIAQKIANNAVQGSKLQSSSVTTEKIADKAVTGAKIKDYDIGYTQIASNCINREKIINGEVLTEKIADGAVTPAKLDAVAPPADGEVPTYNETEAKFEFKPLGAPAVLAHTALTDKEVGGIIDHADESILPGKLAGGSSITPEQPVVVDTTTGLFKSIPFPTPPAGVQLATGKYDGQGGTQAITGVGFRPKVLLIYKRINNSDAGLWIKTDKDSAYSGFVNFLVGKWTWATGYIVSLDADGFTVFDNGTTTTVNDASTASYDYIAFG